MESPIRVLGFHGDHFLPVTRSETAFALHNRLGREVHEIRAIRVADRVGQLYRLIDPISAQMGCDALFKAIAIASHQRSPGR